MSLTRDTPASTGIAFNSFPLTREHWVVDVTIRVWGASTIGADGMALWVVDAASAGRRGSLFGIAEDFQGIGVLVDTFDNDGSGHHPYIALVYNDGTRSFSHDHDHGHAAHGDEGDAEEAGATGSGGGSIELGGCSSSVRTGRRSAKDGPPVGEETTLRLANTPEHGLILSVRDRPDRPFRECARAPVVLPTGYHFGLSAQTGDLSDNHEVTDFSFRFFDPETGALTAEEDVSAAIAAALPGGAGGGVPETFLGRELQRVHHSSMLVRDTIFNMQLAIAQLSDRVDVAVAGAGRAAAGRSAGDGGTGSLGSSDVQSLLLKLDKLERKVDAMSSSRSTGPPPGETGLRDADIRRIRDDVVSSVQRLWRQDSRSSTQAQAQPPPTADAASNTLTVILGVLVLVLGGALAYQMSAKQADRQKKMF